MRWPFELNMGTILDISQYNNFCFYISANIGEIFYNYQLISISQILVLVHPYSKRFRWVVFLKLWVITSDHNNYHFTYLYKIWNQLNFCFSCFYSGGPLCTCATKNLWPKPTPLHSMQVLYLSLELFFTVCVLLCILQWTVGGKGCVSERHIRAVGYDCRWMKPDTPV